MNQSENIAYCDGASTAHILLKLFPLVANITTDKLTNFPAPERCNSYGEKIGRAPCFDFIVVGAGSAGCVLANRLTEIANWNVLLIEAGIEEPPFTQIPATTPYLYYEKFDWGYSAQPDGYSCIARPEGRCGLARGKMMGGSSSVNYMHYLRGFKHDYEMWRKLGNDGWGYKNVLKYFKKSENNLDDDIIHSIEFGKYHGHKGYQYVSRFPHTDPNLRSFIDAWKELGAKETDLNTGSEYGVMHTQATANRGMRVSTNTGYIKPIRGLRKNLHILTESLVTKVIIDRDKRGKLKTYGVEYVRNKTKHVALIKKEVILSAGSFNSPKLLMLSGIGSSDHLKKLNIKVHQDLPHVGKNLHDHVIFGNIMARVNETARKKTCTEVKKDAKLYKSKTLGPYSTTGLIELTSFFNTDHAGKQSEDDFPNISAGIGPIILPPTGFDGMFQMEDIQMSLSTPYDGVGIGLALLSPKSRGYMMLNETDPVWSPPSIYQQTYTDESDLQQIIEAAHIVTNNYFTTKSMRKLGAKLIDARSDRCSSHTFGTTDYWRCLALTNTGSNYHHVGTCKMGPSADRTAVVNPKLVVRGVSNLRVADNSIIPLIPGGHLNAPAIMIGEKASDLIKRDWGISI